MLKHILSVFAFVLVTFAVQGVSHFVINKAHYQGINHLRAETIFPLGLAAMIVQGIILTTALTAWKGHQVTLLDGMIVSIVFGLFLVSYIALVEPAKYTVPSVMDWITVEASVGAMQFVVFGLLLGFVHKSLP